METNGQSSKRLSNMTKTIAQCHESGSISKCSHQAYRGSDQMTRVHIRNINIHIHNFTLTNTVFLSEVDRTDKVTQ